MKNLSYQKKALLVLLLIWFVITANLIKTTYAKYVTDLITGTNVAMSKWNILLNDEDIMDEDAMENILTLTFPGNEYMTPNTIVPGAIGYFDINIDSTKTTVPFNVIVNATIDEESAYTDEFAVSGYSINDLNTITPMPEGQATLSYNIQPTTNNTLIRVYLSWIDDGIADADDTALGIAAEVSNIKVKLRFEQTEGQALVITSDEPTDPDAP
ncbi:MAG: hypothetical protein HUJ68_12570 [Clostridia bacterium]|nr:hypothetical protein [Clostridia bacterium]